MTTADILHMSDDNLLDIDYFLNEEDFVDRAGEEGFYIFWSESLYYGYPQKWGYLLSKAQQKLISYKV